MWMRIPESPQMYSRAEHKIVVAVEDRQTFVTKCFADAQKQWVEDFRDWLPTPLAPISRYFRSVLKLVRRTSRFVASDDSVFFLDLLAGHLDRLCAHKDVLVDFDSDLWW